MPTVGSLFTGIAAFDHAFEQAGWETIWTCEIDPECRRVIEKHHPGLPIIEDVKDVNRGTVAVPDVIIGGSPCFPGGTSILCRDRMKPIEQVRVGDEVLTHKGDWQRVLCVGSRIAPTIELNGHGHPKMRTTAEHPFWSSSVTVSWKDRKHPVRVFAEPCWKPASEMNGRWWASPHVFPEMPIPAIKSAGRERGFDQPLGEDFFWLVGCWIGDGWVDIGQRIARSEGQTSGSIFIATDRREADFLAERISAAGLKGNRREERTATRFHMVNGALARWLEENFGKYCDGKRLATWVLGQPEPLRRALFNGYIWADGSVDEKRIRATSVNRQLLIGMKLLGQSLGYSISLHTSTPKRECVIEGRKVNERPQWAFIAQEHGRSSFVVGDHRFGLVRKIQPTGEHEEVFNIEVERDRSYVADGLVVHNCQGLSLAGKREGLADERSGLFHEQARVADQLAPRWFLWENVAGALSSPPEQPGADFAIVLREVTGYHPEVPKEGWRNSGVCLGPKRAAAWRVLDSQFVGGCPLHGDYRERGPVPQRRRRVFVVAVAGDRRGLDVETPWEDLQRLAHLPVEVLLEPDRLCWNPPKGRRAKKRRAGASGGGAERDCAATLRSRQSSPGVNAPGRGGEDDLNLVTSDVAHAVAAGQGGSKFGSGRQGQDDFVIGTLMAHTKRHGHAMGTQQAAEEGQVVVESLTASEGGPDSKHAHGNQLVAHALTSAGADAMGGTDVGTPLVVESIAYNPHRTLQKDGSVTEGFKPDEIVDALHGPTGNKEPLIVAGTLTAGGGGVSSADRMGELVVEPICDTISPTILGGQPGGTSHGKRSGSDKMPLVIQDVSEPTAFTQNQRNELRDLDDVAGALAAEPGTHQQTFIVNSKDSCATESHAHEAEVARSLDTTGGFASGQGGTVVMGALPAHHYRNTVEDSDRLVATTGLSDGERQGSVRQALQGQESKAASSNQKGGSGVTVVRRLTPT